MFEEFLATLEGPERRALRAVIDHVAVMAPEAEEGRSYGLEAFILHGKPLLGFNRTKTHLSLYPFSPAVIDAVRDRLGGFVLSKGTVRFTPGQPVPPDVLTDLVELRAQEITARP